MKQNRLLAILLLLSLITGILTLTDYGESWDELKLYDYAVNSLDAYVTWFQHGTIPATGDRFENYGPFFVMLTRMITKTFTQIFPAMQEVDVQHLVYFLTFLVGVWAFHHLAIRWMSRKAALGATLLFMTQPLFWGHAFINPKDIPLLSLFLLSVYLGMMVHDRLFGREVGFVLESISAAWNGLPQRTRHLLAATTIFWLASLVILFGGTHFIHQWIDNAVRAAANGEPSLISQIIPRVQRVSPEIYIEKFFVLFLRLRAITFLIITGALIWPYHRHLPVALQALGMILPAGIILGLTVSIRIFGVWAGILVAGYIFWKSGVKAWLVMIAYALIAIIAMYLSWPYLWPDPIGHFFETVQIMAQHPWPGSVLFNGSMHPANDLPASYMPRLLAIQLTEPVWALFFVGLTVAIFGGRPEPVEGFSKNRSKQRELLMWTLVWFFLPLVNFIILRPTLYDNFRQSFFIVPPIFFMTGLAFDQIRKPMLQAALIALMVLPGVIASVRLHPYEYVYYNQFVGGVDAAVDRFELEYWGTSYREAAREANRIAPPNANVWVDGPAHLFTKFARPDFHIYSSQEAERADHYDIVVTLARYDLEKTSFPEAPIVYRVIREGAVFAVIRQP
ncbi:MAG TPA: hypothetical protein VMN99_15195 [Anaerolineales bacterium]|nr:hypothetical protein [Anaerolineales bacterium]